MDQRWDFVVTKAKGMSIFIFEGEFYGGIWVQIIQIHD